MKCYIESCDKKAIKTLDFWCSEQHKIQWQEENYPKPLDGIKRVQDKIAEIIQDKRKKRESRYPYTIRDASGNRW